ncbi:MAG: HD domain-containing protein [Patescibacteria group bacterium]|jgi:tRNA nucleotidyltransferase/poly(A) polymerase|nr:HD domain-containing protein [Patescibacteria group bacterium]
MELTQKKIEQKLIQLEKAEELKFVSSLKKEFPKSEIFLVGGIVRDQLLNRSSKDYDLIVRQIKIKNLIQYLATQGKTNLVGSRFGVIKFKPQNSKINHTIDIALPRTDYVNLNSMGGRKDFNIQTDPNLPIEKDLSRRDFTINAMAWDLIQHKLVDPFNGLKDIKNKLLRAVGQPTKRFQEDYSRMLRALRFSCQLNFEIEDKTWQAIKNLISHLSDQRVIKNKKEQVVPNEVISQELIKSFVAHPTKALKLWDQSGALKEVLPELLELKNCQQPAEFHSEGDVWQHTFLALKKLNSPEFKKEFNNQPPSAELVMAVLLHDIAKPQTQKTPDKDGVNRIRFDQHAEQGADLAKKIAQHLRLNSTPNFEINYDRLAWLIKHHLLALTSDLEKIRNSTIAKYFFNSRYNGQDLLKLMFVDALASLPQNKKVDLTNYYQLKARVEEYKNWQDKNKHLALKPILNGHQIKKLFNLDTQKDGPKIGYLNSMLCQAQQNKKVKNEQQAQKFLQDLYLKIKSSK